MIYESSFWKNDLLKQARFLRSKTNQKRWAESSSARLEQAVMLGFYSIRKLNEARKLSDSVSSQKIVITAYKQTGQVVNRLNWLDIHKSYDLESAQTVAKDLIFLCNQFIHSYIFIEYFDTEGQLKGVFVSSDRERHQRLYDLEIEQIIKIFEQVGNDYPTGITFIYDEKKRDYDVKSIS
jgi:hypothetical protein